MREGILRRVCLPVRFRQEEGRGSKYPFLSSWGQDRGPASTSPVHRFGELGGRTHTSDTVQPGDPKSIHPRRGEDGEDARMSV